MLDTANLTDMSSFVQTVRQNGYDIPLYGMDNGSFYFIHVPAVLCIMASFTCAVIAIVLSFRQKDVRTFFRTWSKSERFVVYLALCDGLFNRAHFTDHLHILIAKEMVYPKPFCEFYGFNLAVFITAQYLMVNIIALTVFRLIYFEKTISFGNNDWKLLLWIFGVPCLGALVSCWTNQLGPNGT